MYIIYNVYMCVCVYYTSRSVTDRHFTERGFGLSSSPCDLKQKSFLLSCQLELHSNFKETVLSPPFCECWVPLLQAVVALRFLLPNTCHVVIIC